MGDSRLRHQHLLELFINMKTELWICLDSVKETLEAYKLCFPECQSILFQSLGKLKLDFEWML